MRRFKLDTLSMPIDEFDPLDISSINASKIKLNSDAYDKKFDEDLAHIYGYY